MAGIDLSSLYNSSQWSDLTIEASGKVFHCHQCIVFSQCEDWKKLPLVNGRLVLTGAYSIKAILKYMYSGTYKPINIPCSIDRPRSLETNAEGTTDKLDYSDNSMFLTACVLARAKAYNITQLRDQAKTALLSIASTLGNHAEFVETVHYVLCTYHDEEGLQIALHMIMPQYETNAGLRNRLKDLLLRHPRLACLLLEHTTEELRAIKREKSLTHYVGKTELGELSGGYSLSPAAPALDSTRSTPLQVVSATSKKRKDGDDEMPVIKRLRESIE
ncbi:hypothetical protein BDP81DRAFT_447823 [Colletotrichum phormii]|uniref:BTB domain-containing protein n=1 Tax=Colletotrichum phormii TaxID=359342 RepID=A0AAI9ZXZ9_9PEZI|nr:uncharacterized protein BDP81DRAFT_447823 [Colletotrichum phormii]KAK1638924.1 hypothetical protein BDP81DRAFT_447823 [Colletotrichum phormii]